MNVHFTRAKGKDNYKVQMMLEGVELKNKERKPNRIAEWKQGKPNKNMIQRIKHGMTMEE